MVIHPVSDQRSMYCLDPAAATGMVHVWEEGEGPSLAQLLPLDSCLSVSRDLEGMGATQGRAASL